MLLIMYSIAISKSDRIKSVLWEYSYDEYLEEFNKGKIQITPHYWLYTHETDLIQATFI